MEEINRDRDQGFWSELGEPVNINGLFGQHVAILDYKELPSQFAGDPGSPDTFLVLKCQHCRIIKGEVELVFVPFPVSHTGTALRHTLARHTNAGGRLPTHGMFKRIHSRANPGRVYVDFVPYKSAVNEVACEKARPRHPRGRPRLVIVHGLPADEVSLAMRLLRKYFTSPSNGYELHDMYDYEGGYGHDLRLLASYSVHGGNADDYKRALRRVLVNGGVTQVFTIVVPQ